MPPRFRPSPESRALVTIAFVFVLVVSLLGCSSQPFDPAAPCTADTKIAGAYPALEALIPREFEDRAPDRVDSGRNCLPRSLASLATHGVSELRFAGATWDMGAGGVTLALLEADDLEIAWVNEFYEVGARAGRNTENVTVGSIQLPDASTAFRLDALNGESFQTIVTWRDGERVRVALIATFIREVQTKEAHETVVDDALAAAFEDTAVATPPSRSGPL